ncbi:MAG TPA: 2-C-methyl-D-erythritol 4-phosphate cytidylyltransferase, partial [Xanthomonadaceae bacterium]|nr:2-C-methyl-D-erythritol 4-phosphate cytidylyltransferase [Xanthomonadaceae bacterium]
MPVWAVVPAAGRGTRFGAPMPKQYLEVAGRPLIAWTLDALLGHPAVAGVVAVLSAGDSDWP